MMFINLRHTFVNISCSAKLVFWKFVLLEMNINDNSRTNVDEHVGWVPTCNQY